MDLHHKILTAVRELVARCWPAEPALVAIDRALEAATASQDEDQFGATMDGIFRLVQAEYPGVHFWWKNEDSHFLGACSQFVTASSITKATLLSGINDTDVRLPWARQGAHYVRDDRDIFWSQSAKLDILERQSRVDGDWVWLRTSKVPYAHTEGSHGGTVGGFEAINNAAAMALRNAKQKGDL